jgi:hypothetical protein
MTARPNSTWDQKCAALRTYLILSDSSIVSVTTLYSSHTGTSVVTYYVLILLSLSLHYNIHHRQIDTFIITL